MENNKLIEEFLKDLSFIDTPQIDSQSHVFRRIGEIKDKWINSQEPRVPKQDKNEGLPPDASSTKNETEKRLCEIIKIAYKLDWIKPNNSGYPLMQLSEVEKCMIAMSNDFEFNRMKKWYEELKQENKSKGCGREYLLGYECNNKSNNKKELKEVCGHYDSEYDVLFLCPECKKQENKSTDSTNSELEFLESLPIGNLKPTFDSEILHTSNAYVYTMIKNRIKELKQKNKSKVGCGKTFIWGNKEENCREGMLCGKCQDILTPNRNNANKEKDTYQEHTISVDDLCECGHERENHRYNGCEICECNEFRIQENKSKPTKQELKEAFNNITNSLAENNPDWQMKELKQENKSNLCNTPTPKSSIIIQNDITKGCNIKFCMDCGVIKGFDDAYHDEICTMGDSGWVTCGIKYDGDLMLCKDCRKQESKSSVPQNLVQKGCGKDINQYSDYWFICGEENFGVTLLCEDCRNKIILTSNQNNVNKEKNTYQEHTMSECLFCQHEKKEHPVRNLAGRIICNEFKDINQDKEVIDNRPESSSEQQKSNSQRDSNRPNSIKSLMDKDYDK